MAMSPAKSRRPKLNDNSRSRLNSLADKQGTAPALQFIHRYFFPSMPDNYSLRKKIQITKNTSNIGVIYDLSQDFCSILMCGVYVSTTYLDSYWAVQKIFSIDVAITAYVIFDILFSWYLHGSIMYMFQFTAIVDMLSAFPTLLSVLYIIIFNRNMGFLTSQLISTLRLIRVIRIFKTLRFFYSVRRAMLKLVLTLFTMIFITAGILQFFESDYRQRLLDCQYINRHTDWQPSCSNVMPFEDMLECDCHEENCKRLFDVNDAMDEPSMVKCQSLTYMGAVYFVITTIASVGFGDILPTTVYSKLLVCIMILLSMIVIPIQINELLFLLSSTSAYKNPYIPQNGENHVIICGYVNAKEKLEAFFKEFFHPDRMFSNGPEYHVVILCPVEPSEDVRTLIVSPMLDARVTYVTGSVLDADDLKKAGADTASGMFFLGNTNSKSDALEDAATVLRTLSASNFNSDLELLVQILHADEREILKDSDVEVILCLDEYKTMLMARNSVCPGFSTFIENIFHSFGALSDEAEQRMAPWYTEYLHGARMELYYVPLDQDFLRAIDFSFDKLCEAVLIEWSTVVLGLCNVEQDCITFNPGTKDLGRHKSFKSFFQEYNIALIIADDNMQAEDIATSLSNPLKVGALLEKIEIEEDIFPVRSTRPRGSGNMTRGLVRNHVITPQTRAPPIGKQAELGKIGMSFLQKLQTKSFRGKAVRSAHSTGESDFNSDESDNEDNYIGYARVRKNGQIVEKSVKVAREFDRATVVYTKSHSTATDDVIPPASKGKGNSAATPKVLKSTEATTSQHAKQRRSVMMQMMPVPIQKIADSERPGKGGTRAARKSMAIPIVKKRLSLVQHVATIAESSDDEDDEDDTVDDTGAEKGGKKDKDGGEISSSTAAASSGSGKRGGMDNKFRASLSATIEVDERADAEDRGHTLVSSTLSTWESVVKDGKRKMSQMQGRTSKTNSVVPTSVGENNPEASSPSTPPGRPAPAHTSAEIEIPLVLSKKPTAITSPIGTFSPTAAENSPSLSHTDTSTGDGAVNAGPTLQHASLVQGQLRDLSVKPTARRLPPLGGVGRSSIVPAVTPTSTPFKPKILPRKVKINVEGPSKNLVTSESIEVAKMRMKSLKKIRMNTSATPKGASMQEVLKELKKKVSERENEIPETLSNRSSGISNRSSEGRCCASEKEKGVEEKDECAHLTAGITGVTRPEKVPSAGKMAGPQIQQMINTSHRSESDEEECKETTGQLHPQSHSHLLKHRASASDVSSDEAAKMKAVDLDRAKSLFARSAQAFGALVGLSKKKKEKRSPKKSNQDQEQEKLDKAKKAAEDEESKQNDKDRGLNVKTEIDGHVVLNDDLTPGNYGLPSKEVSNLYTVKNHIIVFGNCSCVHMLIPELRRPAIRGETYHPLVIVDVAEPPKWAAIKERFNDVYFLKGSLTRSAVFNAANVDDAFAVMLFANKENSTSQSQDANVDSSTLFAYLKLEQHIPRDVFFSVELINASNMAVLNSTIMRRVVRLGTSSSAIVRDKLMKLPSSKGSFRHNLHQLTAPDLPVSDIDRRISLNDEQTDRQANSSSHNGRFTTKRSTTRMSQVSQARVSISINSTKPGAMDTSTLRQRVQSIQRRPSTIMYEPDTELAKEVVVHAAEDNKDSFWDATDTHTTLPVFASGRAYVPSSFDSLLVQSFFGVLTPLICAKFICGQDGQSVVQIGVPKALIGRRFIDMFRLFSVHHVICFGLYRAPQASMRACLPYVYITPPSSTFLSSNDRVFLYGKPTRVARCVAASKSLRTSAGGPPDSVSAGQTQTPRRFAPSPPSVQSSASLSK